MRNWKVYLFVAGAVFCFFSCGVYIMMSFEKLFYLKAALQTLVLGGICVLWAWALHNDEQL